MSHLNVYHNLGLLKDAIRHKRRSVYIHNTPEIRDVMGNLQKYGYIGRFIAVNEPFQPKISKRIQNRKTQKRKEESRYLLIFLKYRLSNKHLPVLGGIYYHKRPNRYKIPYSTNAMKVWNQGVGMEFVRIPNQRQWIPSQTAKLNGIDGYKGFKVWS